MKKTFYIICCVINYLLIIYLLSIPFLDLFFDISAYDILTSKLNSLVLAITSYPIFILLIKNIIIGYKKDKNLFVILLVIFNMFYSPFYFIRILKNNWL